MPELMDGKWTSEEKTAHGIFTVPKDGEIELDGQSCTVLDKTKTQVENIKGSGKTCKVYKGQKCYMLNARLLFNASSS